VSLTAI
jgi:glutamate 5-kinase